jgi:hypothetical protein
MQNLGNFAQSPIRQMAQVERRDRVDRSCDTDPRKDDVKRR